jgi:plasmid replication initiation protein
MVQICFAPDVIPLITRLESNFTSYEIQQISSLSSAYAIRLYELLIKWRSLGQTPLINIADFRKQLGVGIDEYQRMGAFKERVLNLAMQQINEHTDILINYEQQKAGRVITGFTFSFTQKKQSKDVTPQTQKAKPKPTEDLNTLLHDKKFLEKHARAGESWEDVRSRLRSEAEVGK